MHPKKIGFIGLGHIGGSIARTIRRIHPDIRLTACDASDETIQQALEETIIDEGSHNPDDSFEDCDIIYLCTPVLINGDYLPQMKELALRHPSILITDIGSVKTGIHESVKACGLEENFIGGHPMCGTEHTGFAYSTAYMLENAYYILTPTEKIPSEIVEEFEEFTASLGAIPLVLNCRKHDFSVGSVSHLPHVISATLVNLVHSLDDDQETLKTIAAGGFKDITRISSSSPLMWENICIANRDQLLELIDTYIEAISRARHTIASGDAKKIYSFFEHAKDYRDSFQVSTSGPIQPSYVLHCDLIDEAGGIAAIATILAANNISIKNIGIVHNREYEQGVLLIEFYQKDACEHAADLLEKYHYTVYRR